MDRNAGFSFKTPAFAPARSNPNRCGTRSTSGFAALPDDKRSAMNAALPKVKNGHPLFAECPVFDSEFTANGLPLDVRCARCSQNRVCPEWGFSCAGAVPAFFHIRSLTKFRRLRRRSSRRREGGLFQEVPSLRGLSLPLRQSSPEARGEFSAPADSTCTYDRTLFRPCPSLFADSEPKPGKSCAKCLIFNTKTCIIKERKPERMKK